VSRVVILHSDDNVAVALSPLEAGCDIDLSDGTALSVGQAIPIYFKVSLRDVPNGGPILKYGQTIGVALADIARGDLVHVHNMASCRARGDQAK